MLLWINRLYGCKLILAKTVLLLRKPMFFMPVLEAKSLYQMISEYMDAMEYDSSICPNLQGNIPVSGNQTQTALNTELGQRCFDTHQAGFIYCGSFRAGMATDINGTQPQQNERPVYHSAMSCEGTETHEETSPTQNNCVNPTTNLLQTDPDLSEKIGQEIIVALEREIKDTCKIIGICSDPYRWSNKDCIKWLMWHMEKLSIPKGDLKFLQMSGAEMCLLTVADFRGFFPLCGDNLHAQLDVWKNASQLSFLTTQKDIVSKKPPGGPECKWNWTIKSDLSKLERSGESLRCSQKRPSKDKYQASQAKNFCAGEKVTSRQTIHLWEFLKELLRQPDLYSSCIKWVNKERGIFKIENSTRVAELWGKRKNRPAMNYDKLSRSIRQYYKKNIIRKTEHSKRLVYQFCERYL